MKSDQLNNALKEKYLLCILFQNDLFLSIFSGIGRPPPPNFPKRCHAYEYCFLSKYCSACSSKSLICSKNLELDLPLYGFPGATCTGTCKQIYLLAPICKQWKPINYSVYINVFKLMILKITNFHAYVSVYVGLIS